MAPKLNVADHVTLKAGEDLTIEADGEGVGGYVWSAEVLAGNGSVRRNEAAPVSTALSIGGGTSTAFTVSAGEPGMLVLQFSLGRAWEDTPESVREVTVKVVK